MLQCYLPINEITFDEKDSFLFWSFFENPLHVTVLSSDHAAEIFQPLFIQIN